MELGGGRPCAGAVATRPLGGAVATRPLRGAVATRPLGGAVATQGDVRRLEPTQNSAHPDRTVLRSTSPARGPGRAIVGPRRISRLSSSVSGAGQECGERGRVGFAPRQQVGLGDVGQGRSLRRRRNVDDQLVERFARRLPGAGGEPRTLSGLCRRPRTTAPATPEARRGGPDLLVVVRFGGRVCEDLAQPALALDRRSREWLLRVGRRFVMGAGLLE